MNKHLILWFAALFLTSALAQNSVVSKRFELAKASNEQILEDEGNTVRVAGFVESTQVNATGIHFLRFKDSEFSCVTFARHVKDFPEGPPSDIYKEKWVEVTGVIENYRGKPQLRLTQPGQVKMIEPLASPAAPVAANATTPPPSPEAAPENKESEKPPVEDATPVVKASTEKPGRVTEIINGVEALDWRKYFPE